MDMIEFTIYLISSNVKIKRDIKTNFVQLNNCIEVFYFYNFC